MIKFQLFFELVNFYYKACLKLVSGEALVKEL
jgi:hypothetical protein